jgi:hypothetical protein
LINYNDKSIALVEGFINKTKVISMDGTAAPFLIKKLENEFEKQNIKNKEVYIERIKSVAKHDGYDENGILITVDNVLNAINEDNSTVSLLDFKMKSKEIVNEFCKETKIIDISGEYSKTLQKLIVEELQNQSNELRKKCVEKIQFLAKNDAYDEQGVIVQTTSAIKAFNQQKLTIKKSRKPGN